MKEEFSCYHTSYLLTHMMDILTVNSRKYRTLFINYNFRWLMVAEFCRKYRSKLRHRGRDSPILSFITKAISVVGEIW